MQLTKGQKDALVRKVMAIIEEKKEAKRKELIKAYKPSKEAVKFLSKIKKFLEAREVYFKAIDDLGFESCYSYVSTGENEILGSYEIGYSNRDIALSTIEEKIRDKELAGKYNDIYKYPTEESVTDELELSNISKSFDVDAFLAKYQNL